jgi:hypothetical protein
VWCDGEPEPTRVRASWIGDEDIAATVQAYAPGQQPTPPENGGPVVIDLTDKNRARREP